MAGFLNFSLVRILGPGNLMPQIKQFSMISFHTNLLKFCVSLMLEDSEVRYGITRQVEKSKKNDNRKLRGMRLVECDKYGN